MRFAGMISAKVLLYPAIWYCSLEYTVHLLCWRSRIQRAPNVTLLWVWSFGHQSLDLHMLALRFPSERVCVLFSEYTPLNRYILGTFPAHIDVCMLKHTWLMDIFARRVIGRIRLKSVKLSLLRRFVAYQGRNQVVIPDFHERQGSRLEGQYMTEYVDLLKQPLPVGVIEPTPTAIEEFRSILGDHYPAYVKRWCIALYLRLKRHSEVDPRDTEPMAYRSLITMINSLGGFVFCGGDYNPKDLFGSINGVFGYDDFSCSRHLTDFYFLSQSRFMVGTHSGTIVTSTVFGTPTLITNCGFFYLSGFRPNQLVMFKKLRDSSGRILRASETFRMPIVEYSHSSQFHKDGLSHIDHTAEELIPAFQQMIDQCIHGRNCMDDEYRLLIDRFRSLVPAESVAACSPCVPVKSYLQKLEW